MKLWSVAAGGWVCLILLVVELGCSGAVRVDPYSSSGSGILPEEYYPATEHKYSSNVFPTQEFNLDARAPVRRYTNFIAKIRSLLNSGLINGIASMPARVLTGIDRYGLLKINVSSTQTFVVTVVIDLNDLYVVGLHCNNVYYYLKFSQAEPDKYGDSRGLFATTTRSVLLPYEGSYGALGGRDVNLGRQPLIDALTIVAKVNVDVYQLKPPFVVVIQMIPEAVRSGYVMNFVADNYASARGAKATEEVKAVENSWSTMSKTVRKTKGNVLPNKIVLIAGKWEVTTLTEIQNQQLVSLLKYDPKQTNFPDLDDDGDQHHLVTRMINSAGAYLQQLINWVAEEEGEDIVTSIKLPQIILNH
ncbi:hypothetical protein Tsubulata_045196 [Turnera subulata]|uniref:rRNA N-glycosylase n=1 Tax=Turnera subulata TaxID=218843 RepID=A0A9Q0FXR4_9ROSI|nr:hypothetical protein Tsubulata_045196 [Turnera subulata]